MDLSKLLGDLYEAESTSADEAAPPTDAGHKSDVDDTGTADVDQADVDHGQADQGQATDGFDPSAGPDWSDELRLEQAFADWTPGPPSDAPAAERQMAYAGAAAPPAGSLPPDPPASAFGEDLGELEPVHGEVPEHSLAEAVAARPWSRSDDDVLPHARRRGARRLSLRRR